MVGALSAAAALLLLLHHPRVQSYGVRVRVGPSGTAPRDTCDDRAVRQAATTATGRYAWSPPPNPLTLHVNDDPAAVCTLARIVFHLGMPFVTEEAVLDALFAAAAAAAAVLAAAAGVPAPARRRRHAAPARVVVRRVGGARPGGRRIAPATGREDVAAWIDCVDEFVEFSRSARPDLRASAARPACAPLCAAAAATACRRSTRGAFSMDDAMARAAALRNRVAVWARTRHSSIDT